MKLSEPHNLGRQCRGCAGVVAAIEKEAKPGRYPAHRHRPGEGYVQRGRESRPRPVRSPPPGVRQQRTCWAPTRPSRAPGVPDANAATLSAER